MKKRPGKKRSRSTGKKTREASYHVFISHATYDKWIAERICESLESRQITTFIDNRDIPAGDRISDEIKAAIERCDELVVLLTPESVAREWVLTELAMADILGKRIVGIMYHIEPEKAPALLRADMRRMLQLSELEQYLEQVAGRAENR